MRKPPRETTILFLDECPLACTYCNLTQRNFENPSSMTYEEVDAIVAATLAKPDADQYTNIILFTGGEPLVRWDIIEAIITKYGQQFIYKFNTSGYLFNADRLKFLSQYTVEFVLSVDGDSSITDTIRPLVNPAAKPFYARMKEDVFPYLLYYFPNVQWKNIIFAEHLDKIYNCYMAAEEAGFKSIKFVIDFNIDKLTPEQYAVLQLEFDKILAHMIIRFHNGDIPVIVDGMGQFLVNQLNSPAPFTVDQLVCGLFNGRTQVSIWKEPNGEDTPVNSYCLAKEYPNQADLRAAVEAEYHSLNSKCPNDPECPYFNYCCKQNCIKNSLDTSQTFFAFKSIECQLQRLIADLTIKLLAYGNQALAGISPAYDQFVYSKLKREEVPCDGSNDLLPA